LAETRSPKNQTPVDARVAFCRRTGRTIDIAINVNLQQSKEAVWKKVSDLRRFLTIDPFHEQVILMRDEPDVGVHLALRHNACGWRFWRFGKILRWREGSEVAFSDLSRHGRRCGFPHIFFIHLRPENHALKPRTVLTIRVRGKWTSHFVPVAVGRFWIWLVCRDHARLLGKAL
jgi:hypothetical protein